MKNTEAPGLRPATARGGEKSNKQQIDPRKFFIMAALDMSWRLAIVVLVPVIAGVELGKHYHKTVLFTVIGFALAIAGVTMVLRQVLQQYSPKPTEGAKK